MLTNEIGQEAKQTRARLKAKRAAVEAGLYNPRTGNNDRKLSKTAVGLCKQPGCWNERAPGSSRCQPCSDDYKKRIAFDAACEKGGVCRK